MRILLIPVICLSLLGVDPKEEALVAKRRNYWAFQAPVRVDIPKRMHPVDALQPATRPLLEGRALVRRLSLDLTGLPPTPVEVEQYLAKPDYAALVDRLLASPHYGERIGQKWLDVVRYADTNGFELDAERPQAWRYRDYVIRSFNANKPYDLFVKEQLAGDELYPGSREGLIATGFLRAGQQHVVGGNLDSLETRQENLIEMTHAISSAFLGLTMNCARCHNHKFDPILQADYYRMQALLASTEYRDVQLADGDEMRAADLRQAKHDALIKPILDELKKIEDPYREQYKRDKKPTLEAKYREALDLPKDSLTEEQKRLRKDAEKQLSPTWDEVVALIPADLKAKRAALRQRMHVINLDEPDPADAAYGVLTVGQAADTQILKVGDPHNKLDKVEPGLPLVLAKDLGNLSLEARGRRATLAQWIASPSHPLTARVMVNRLWQFRMGKGIVATANDFGALGARPANLKLLDWLATEFVASGWDVKHIDKLILTSETYRQQASQRRRLDSDSLRDSILFVSGTLNAKMYGKPIKTPIEPEIYEIIFTEGEPDNLWPLPKDKTEMNRRTIYLLNKRTIRLPMLQNFDQPDTITSCPERPTSVSALQGLSMLNSDFIQAQAKAFAARFGGDVDRAYQLALGRPPSDQERKLAKDFFAKGGTAGDFALALLNRNDFVYLP